MNKKIYDVFSTEELEFIRRQINNKSHLSISQHRNVLFQLGDILLNKKVEDFK